MILINLLVLLGGLDTVSSGNSEKLVVLLTVACTGTLVVAISWALYILGKKAAWNIRKRILLRRLNSWKTSTEDMP